MSYKQDLFAEAVTRGFTPLKQFVEVKRLEQELTSEDIAKIMQVIGRNLENYVQYLRMRNAQLNNK